MKRILTPENPDTLLAFAGAITRLFAEKREELGIHEDHPVLTYALD